MAISLKHAFQSAKGDPVDATLVRPTNWNAEHNLTMATGKLLGRTTASTGAAEEITPDATLTLAAGALGVAPGGVGNTQVAAGAVVAVSHAEYATHTAIATAIPVDNTTPLVGEGTQILTVAHTPKSATNKLIVEVAGGGALNTTGSLVVAVFDGSTCKRALPVSASSADLLSAALKVVYVPGDVLEHTISVRIGPDAGTFYPNGTASERKLGGASAWALTVTEVKA